ncbi:YafY family protein [uncultured Leifsonia sp.]|uniref:helix-turn-helix transcriptional regulator n=1 Tax=uncultured Leifsonia sp. TaxID=340359 RepID=UPI0025FEAA09|nr:YafY family protein [uncultured Leifsonia sp.]
MNRTDRLYALVEELRAVAPRPRSARWLAERFEVSSRTIERDLSALQQSGVPIWAEPGRAGGYAIDRSHTLPPLGFTVGEALAVSAALGVLASSPFAASAASALRKVVAVMDDGRLRETAELTARIHVLDDGGAPQTVAGLDGALTSGRVHRITYRDRAGAETVRDVEPLGFVNKGRDWYLVAWCRLRDGLRAFRVDRIVTVEATAERPPHRSLSADDLDIVYGELRTLTLGEDRA